MGVCVHVCGWVWVLLKLEPTAVGTVDSDLTQELLQLEKRPQDRAGLHSQKDKENRGSSPRGGAGGWAMTERKHEVLVKMT